MSEAREILKKQFTLADVLSITTGRLVSERHIEGVYDILNWMTGDNLFTHQLPRAADACSPDLARQFPRLHPDTNPELQFEIGMLVESLDRCPTGVSRDYLITGWLSGLKTKYGFADTYQVEPLCTVDYESKDPLAELQEMVGADRVVAIRAQAAIDNVLD